MNLEKLINKYKIEKIMNPLSTIKVEDLDLDMFNSVKSSILNSYNLTDPIYSTKEWVFFDTRRIVAKSEFNPLANQIFSNLDFDNSLSSISLPIVKKIQTDILPGYIPAIIQLATLLPQQKLEWHVDVFLYQQFSNKLHIPITTNKDSFVDLFNGNNVIRNHMTEGSVWNINNLELHRSINLGTTYRTHLIIDFMKEETVTELLNLGIDFFHTKIPRLSDFEQNSKDLLIKKYS